jgi:hypothetical protein
MPDLLGTLVVQPLVSSYRGTNLVFSRAKEDISLS